MWRRETDVLESLHRHAITLNLTTQTDINVSDYMFSKISIRNIPTSVFQALELMAVRHDRSTEAEARQAIQAWVEPVLVQENRSVRLKEVSERLSRLLQQVNANHHGLEIRPSHIAKQIKEERAAEVEDWFLGNIEPTFSQLEAIAQLFGINADWIQHGDGPIYPVHNIQIPRDVEQAVQWLMAWKTEEGEVDALKKLHLIRNSNEKGDLYIVKESVRGHFQIFFTPIRVSESIGTGGEASLTYLFVTLELLYERTHEQVEYDVVGYQLSPADVTLLTNGQTNPGALLSANNVSMWWEDIWDRSMVEKHNYWLGWQSLCNRIDRAIEHSDRLFELRQKIRSGELR